jgi:hypothetical protein
MTGSTACVFLSPNRVSLNEAFEVLEPDDGKLSRPVLRGPGPSNGVRLLDPHVLRRFLRPPLTEARSLHRSYPASSVVRTSPPDLSLASCQLIDTMITCDYRKPCLHADTLCCGN